VRTASFLALALALALGLLLSDHAAVAQPKGPALKPQQIYAQFRDTMNEGKFDIAGIFLDQFLKSDPTDEDFLELQKKYGTTTFRSLRTVPRYSDDPATEKKIRADIEELNKRADAVVAKVLYNPERVKKYVRNLGETYEEKVYAQQELRRTGEFAVPFMIEAIRQNPSEALYAGILDTIPVLEGPTMAGWIAALDGFTPDRVVGIVGAIAQRRDVLELTGTAQTDITPYLWRYLSRDPKDVAPELRKTALALLNRLYPGIKADTRRPEVELTELARKFYDHKARYIGTKTNPDGSPATVPVWVWEEKALKLNKLPEVPVGQAEEYFGLRYARWALDAKPEYEPAQSVILALAAERAVERSRGGILAVTEPDTYRLLAAAPSPVLIELLNRGLGEKRTPLVLATVQVLGDRADRAAAFPPPGPGAKPSPLMKALTYPDPSVQFAAATALLRSPVPVAASAKPMIVDILRRAAGADPGAPGESKGTVLLADPGKYRSDANALLFRGLGFNVEQFGSGRELMRRVARASDFDVIFIDRHTADPELIDLIAHLDSNPQTAARPVFVIASADKPRVPTFDQLLVRTAALIAATENDIIAMPAPYVPDPRVPANEQAETRRVIQDRRDDTFRTALAARAARLQRVIDALPLTLNEEQKRLLYLRVQQISYAMLGAEFPITPDSAPRTVADLQRLNKQLALQPPTAAYGTGAPSTDLMKLIERFELDVAKVKGAQEKYDMLRSSIDPIELGLAVETYRDRPLEAKLARTLSGYPAVKIIPEPYSRLNIEAGFKLLYADPMMIPRDGAAKRADAKTAVEFLRLMAISELPGYDLKTTEPVLIAALQQRDLAPIALDAVERFKTAEAQLALLEVALTGEERLRPKAADAVIRHIRMAGSAITPNFVTALAERAKTETNLELRGKFLTILGMVATKPNDFANQLKEFNPPIVVPKKEPEKKEPEKAEPEKKP
jgi:CheY-like chemotaxis protein